MIYFWREKNANQFVGKRKVVEPTKEELEKELILKLKEKSQKIDVVFDEKAREKYYLTDKKPKKSLDGLTEQEIVGLLGKRLAVDLLQLCFDLCNFLNFQKFVSDENHQIMSIQEIKSAIDDVVEAVQFDFEDVNFKLDIMKNCAREIARMAGVSWQEVVTLQKELELEEGSFFKGKYVYFDEE